MRVRQLHLVVCSEFSTDVKRPETIRINCFTRTALESSAWQQHQKDSDESHTDEGAQYSLVQTFRKLNAVKIVMMHSTTLDKVYQMSFPISFSVYLAYGVVSRVTAVG